jgi:Ca2+-binding RTX toxin-like protein
MSFHLYRFTELYSDASGTLQFIELGVGNANGESFWAGVTLSSTRAGVTHSITFPANLPSTATANTTVLIATAGFAARAGVTPDFVMPDGFLFPAGGSLNFGGADVFSHAPLPADGALSLLRSGATAVATPKNFAGQTGRLLPTITGTAGDDTLTGTAADEWIDGLDGNDTIRSGGGNDVLRGGDGDDFIFSGIGNDSIDGGDGYDYLYYSEALAGVVIDMRSGVASGGAGNDTFVNIELIFGSAFDDTFIGHDGGVGFLGGDGNDTITGGAGNDHLEGNGGDDIIDGLGGRDRVAYYSAAFAVDVNLSLGRASGGLGNDVLRNIEDVTGSVFDDTLTGDAGDNRLEGGDGNDSFHSTAGDDILDGGAGLDRVHYPLARQAYTLLRSSEGVFSVEKPDAAGSDTLIDTERLHFSDLSLALDLDGPAGQTAKLLGAVFGVDALGNRAYVGIGLSLLDGGTSYEQLAALAMAAAGKTSHVDVVDLLWTRLFGSAPTTEQAAPYVALLDAGMSVGALTVLAADLDLNAVAIDLVGLAQTGIEFVH